MYYHYYYHYYLISPKPGHITGRSRRGARRGGGAGSGRTVRQQNCSSREHSFLVPSKASKTRRLNVSPGAKTRKILSKPMEEQSTRLTTGSLPVYHRFISGARSALSSWLLTSGPTPCSLCKPSSYKACPGITKTITNNTCRIQNPNIPRASRYGAAHGGTAGPGGDGQHRMPTMGLFAE